MNINNIFISTRYNQDLLNIILEFARPNRSFKSKTAKLIKGALSSIANNFNPIVYSNKEIVIFWKDRKKMPTEIYYMYRKHQKSNYYTRCVNK